MKRVFPFHIFILFMLLCILTAGCSGGDIIEQVPVLGDPPPFVGTSDQTTVDNACYEYTPQITEDTFRYLDEIYIEKYPLLGLRWEHGTGADQRIITAFAQQATQGCDTDAEKVAAIFKWITGNIRYEENSSPFSYDVLYYECGNCLGKALLMQDMCRVLGIPAVYADGFRGNMKTFSVEDMHAAEAGHAWLFVYVDGQWSLYDPTWGTGNLTDLSYISENFYIDKVGGITPVYDENNIPPFSDPVGSYCYMNGRFIAVIQDETTDQLGGSLVNFCMNVSAYHHGVEAVGNSGFFYWDGPASFAYVGIKEHELYTNGWVGYGESCFLWGDVSYAYENGILASETVVRRGDEIFFCRGGLSNKLCVPDEEYRIIGGDLAVSTSYVGKIWEPHENMLPKGEYTYEWFSTNEAVATVDQNGVVTCHKAGSASICVKILGVGQHGNEEYLLTEDLNPMVITGGKEYRGFSMHVSFHSDISRPEKYAALDSGGAAYIEFPEAPRLGMRDIYPVMTDDMLMMFDPVDGVITLPTAQNANGYFIMPDTYESALTFPHDFKLPLADGTLLLDRETLRKFTLVDTGYWGEMWYLPLNEKGMNVWGPGGSVGPEQPNDIDFGYPMIPTEELMTDYIHDGIVAEITPENGVINLHAMTDFNGAAIFKSALQIAGAQNCGLKFTFRSGTMTLDSATVQTLLSGPEADMMELWFVRMENEWCDFGQQERLKRMAVDGIYHLHAEYFVENGDIHHLNGGSITVTVPLNATGGNYGVFFVDGHGNFTEIPSAVNGNSITFEAPYFATYAVIDKAQTPVK